jgi:hypothetical protein
MGGFMISRSSPVLSTKLLLEVSVDECGCPGRFVPVGSNIV